jgi:hypothetical protein
MSARIYSMLILLLLTALLASAENPQQTGIITGSVVLPPQQEISGPVQVILLSRDYADLWINEVQKRLDRYWQQFQPAFRYRKETFTELSKQAHKEATNYVVTRMQRDSSANISEYLMQTSADGKFEFKNIPFGEYKVLAVGKIGNQDVMWHEFIDVRSAIPHFLELKKRVP